MSEITRLFGAEDKQAISQAIQRAEEKSGCEIIPVMAVASGRYDRGEDVFGVVFALALVALAWWGMSALADQTPMGNASGWQYGEMAPFGLPVLLALFGGGFLLGALMATRIGVLKLPFTAKAEMRQEVRRAAQSCFFARGLRKAPGAAGVLIYVSHFERMVEVIGDDAVNAKLSAADWQAICNEMLGGLSRGAPTVGFVAALDKTADLLEGAFIDQDGDETGTTRFADELVLLDD